MAVTKGHGNPNWTREEIILALELYNACAGVIPGPRDPRVKDLSDLLRAFPHHAIAARQPSFRNPDGVAFKLQNLRKIATGTGLPNHSQTDEAVWRELGESPADVTRIATLIRACLDETDGILLPEDDAEVFYEGRIVTAIHRKRERSPKVRAKLLKIRRANGRMACEICQCSPSVHPEGLQDSIFEAHHKLPLSAGPPRATRVSDMALLCANCHRMMHSAIARTRQWLNLDEVRVLLSREGAVAQGGVYRTMP